MSKKEKIEMVKGFFNERYYLRNNIVKGQIQYRRKEAKGYKAIDDGFINSNYLEIQSEYDTGINKALLIDILNSDFVVEYNPFVEYFEGLPKVDNSISYISELAKTINCHDNDFFNSCLRKWLVGMVAGVLDNGLINHQVIVLSGSQGIGKSTWIRNLVPDELREYFYSGKINPNRNADTMVALSECMLIDLDELENLSKRESGSLKEIITKTQINHRRPYARTSEIMPRRASFIGSTNGTEILYDKTGSRRYLCFEVLDIDIAYEIDVESILSESYRLYLDGFRWHFDKKETKLIENNNLRFTVVSDIEEQLITRFTPEQPTKLSRLCSASEVFKLLTGLNTCSMSQSVSMGLILNRHGYIAKKEGGLKKYAVVEYENPE